MTSSETLNWWSDWSDFLAVTGSILGALVAAVAIAGWFFSWKAGKLKDEALETFKIESKKSISEADVKSAEANRIAAQANERASQLELGTEKLKKEAAEAKLELLKLQQKLAWRVITPEQEASFIAFLAGAPKGKITITYLSNDPEALNFTALIADLLLKSGYDSPKSLADMSSVMPIGGVMIGVTISVQDEKNAAAVALQQALGLISIEAMGRVRPNQQEAIAIEIGQKVP